MTQILSHLDTKYKAKCIACQIYENHLDEGGTVLAEINGNGLIFTERLNEVLATIAPLKATLCKVVMGKKDPLAGITTSVPPEAYAHKSVIVVDDVLNSGLTLIYGVEHFLEAPPRQLITAALVNRSYRKYPIRADFKGISLSTSLQECVSVVSEEGNYLVNLSMINQGISKLANL